MKKELLKPYQKKRDFKKTKEPSGKEKVKAKKKLSFVIQEHHASHLHWDFRLEWDGVLKSWAVPKGPSEDPAVKRLAVQVEDHPLSYGKFHGTIPKGQYGAGEVYIWDAGTWEPDFDPEVGLKKGKLEFTLKGKKLSGHWVLVRTHYKETATKKNWLLIKTADKKKLKKQDEWPGFVPPQLPKLVTEPPLDNSKHEKWIHEMKFDGYRLQFHLQAGKVRCFTRNNNDWSHEFPLLLQAVSKLPAENLIIDGELVALDEKGHSDFQKLQNSLKTKNNKDLFRLKFYVFDILFLDGEDLRQKPLIERKDILKKLITKKSPTIMYSEHLLKRGKDFFELSCEEKLEGIVSKLADAPYRSGRNDLWVKTKCTKRQEFVIGGYTAPEGSRTGFGALLLGVQSKGKLKYVGRVGTGFNHQSLRLIQSELLKIKQDHSPFEMKSPKENNLHWVKPIKVAEVSFSQWTADDILRTPVFMGMREDKKVKDIKMEKAKVKISSPNKILFKKEKITKQNIVDFYDQMAKVMLPYVADRPLSLVRCPEGSEKACFYQKHIKGMGTYITINSKEGLEQLVQMNAFELHEWNCHRENIMNPDQIVMDFDPGPGVPWKNVIKAAYELKEILDDLNLKSFLKVTGGKGLHVHIPISPLYSWDQVKNFAQALAQEMVDRNPAKYTANMSKKLRKGKIFVDYLRNGYGATAVVPYSLRAKPISAVAMPIEWKELPRIVSADQFSLEKALAKLKRRKQDPWKGMLKLKQKISILME